MVQNIAKKYGFLLILAFYLPVLFYHIDTPILDTYSFRQTQTATVVRNFYKHGINLFKTELDVFGEGKAGYVLLEFPIYQTLVCILYKIFFPSEIWGRLLSIIMAYIGTYFLFKLVLLLTEEYYFALFVSFCYLSIPINLHFNRTFLIESTVMATITGFLYCFTASILKEQIVYWLLGLLLASISFIHKSLYGPFFLIPIVYLIVVKNKKFNKIFLLLSLTIPLIFMIKWQMYCESINLASGHSSLTLTDKNYIIRNFGTIKERFLFSTYKQGILNLYPELLTPLTIIPCILGFIKIRLKKNSVYFYLLLISSVLYYFVLIKLQMHHYYNMVITPIVAILIAEGVWCILNYFKTQKIKRAFLFFFSILNIILSIEYAFRYHKFDAEDALLIGDIVKKNVCQFQNIIISFPKYDWTSAYVYYSDRKGIHIDSSELTKERIKELIDRNYVLLICKDYKKYLDLEKEHKFLLNYSTIYKDSNLIILKLGEK